MCGIAGVLQRERLPHPLGQVIHKMSDALQRRGPDGDGVWIDTTKGVAFGHRRLAVVDLSEAGRQPMISGCGRYVLTYNGEIYNHLDIRRTLEDCGVAPVWKGHSDTETLLVALSYWGLEKTLAKLIGMFAFALWDQQDNSLSLARDRMGEKPLYYGLQKECFLFASDLSALEQHPQFQKELNVSALPSLMQRGYVATPSSIYRNVQKLQAGHFLKVFGTDLTIEDVTPRPYWQLEKAIQTAKATPFSGTRQDAVEALESRLSKAIGRQMSSDVPLGAFLSGGIDSSTVVSLMQKQSSSPVHTFTIGFDQQDYNEALVAKKIATHLQTDHTELYVTDKDALDVVPKLADIYSEPFADSSQIPTHLVSELARKHVTVSLSGDGGDEVFGGYNRYIQGAQAWTTAQRLPRSVRKILAKGLSSVAPQNWDKIYNALPFKKFNATSIALPGDKIHKLASVLAMETSEDFYARLTQFWKHTESVISADIKYDNQADIFQSDYAFEEKMMAQDTLTYLCDDILTKVDRAAMYNSLETRVPILDHTLVEWAWSLPLSYKIHEGQGKWVLRQVLQNHVPKHLVDTPKMGFGVPLGSWLRGPLKDWASDYLSYDALKADGYLNAQEIQNIWAAHQRGAVNAEHKLWPIIAFMVWKERAF